MVKTYKVITARKQEDIEDKINQLAVDGWVFPSKLFMGWLSLMCYRR